MNKTKFGDLKGRVLKLSSNRVWRTYFGGKEIERWQGAGNPRDSDMPEEWIASIVNASNPGREHIANEGLSSVMIESGGTALLKNVIESDTVGFLGAAHCEKYGTSMAVLVKMIASLGRLTLQVHPDKEFAKRVFHSDYGKSEAWYILGGRTVDREDPYVLLGFKPGITREKWKALFEKQDIAGMLDALHKVPVKQGEVYLIGGGLPHAIGPGCFLIEIQEPTDFTLRTERQTPEGRAIPDLLCHQGAGFDRLFDCFHYEGLTREELLAKWRIAPTKRRIGEHAIESILVGEQSTQLFGMKKLEISGVYQQPVRRSFFSSIVLSGKGRVRSGNHSLDVKQGDFLFIPAAVCSLSWEAESRSCLEVIECFPPK